MSKRVFFFVSIALVVVGAVAWAFQLANGLKVTNMSNLFNWGFYIGCFAFLVGVAAGGMIISSSIYLFKLEKLKPFGKIASLSAFACSLGAGLMVLVDLGSIQNILNIFIHPNFMSPLVWDVIVIACYIVLTFLSVYFQLLPDCKEKDVWFFNGWVRKKSTEEVAATSKKWSRRVALIGLPFAILIHTVTALIFATQNGHEWWHSAILPPDFIAMAVASGGSLVLIVAIAVMGKDFDKYKDAFSTIAKIVAGALIVHFFFTCMELILLAWTGSLATSELLGALFGTYGLLYAVEIILPLIAMILFLTKKVQNKGIVIGGSILVLIGTLVHRMMLLFPTMSSPTLAFETMSSGMGSLWLYPVSAGRIDLIGLTFTSMYEYMPSGIEYLVALLPIGIILLVISFMNLKYPLFNKQ